ncbi:OmpA family protein [Pseudomonas sp. LF245]
MSITSHRVLVLWAGGLLLALLAIIPISVWARATGILLGMAGIGLAWVAVNRRAAALRASVQLDDTAALPAASFRHPVLLVCGDGLDALFAPVCADRLVLRVIPSGCYVRVPSLEQLPAISDAILALRPGWGAQLCVMFVVNPSAHADNAALLGRVRTFGYQAALVRKRGIALPLLLVSYLQTLQGADPWFSWEQGESQPCARDNNQCTTLDEWQQQAVDTPTRAARLHACVQLNSVAQWLHVEVLPSLGRHDTDVACVCAIKMLPVLPQAVEGNLWCQWLAQKVALVDRRVSDASAALPFPDALLSVFKRGSAYTSLQRASVVALWLWVVASAAALASSAWQNTLLLRQVSDDLRRYTSIPPPTHREQRAFLLREDAITALRHAARRLDIYYRQGEPLALGLGLYRGEHLRAPLLAVLAAHVEPPMTVLPAGPARVVRLDSLSLFATGSARLKPGSTKVLINALVGIKAQPGLLIVIAGHTDATGDAEKNLRLSYARAAAVHGWMQQMGGIPDSCFAVQGFGASQPIASNDTDAGRAANRRVDIRLVPSAGACSLPPQGSVRQPPVAYRDV